MDEDEFELSILNLLKDNIQNAFVGLYPDDIHETEQSAYIPGHENADIHVNLGDIYYGELDGRQCSFKIEIEITYYAKLMRGIDGWREICNNVRRLLTQSYIGLYPTERVRLGFNDTGHYMIGERYIWDEIYTIGE